MPSVVKVSSRSNPNLVAGAMAALMRESGRAEVLVVGAGALNQAVKAVVVTQSYLSDEGVEVCCRPAFAAVDIDGEARTGIRLVVLAHDDPEATAAPEITVVSEATASPEATAAPEGTAASEATVASQAAPAPEATSA